MLFFSELGCQSKMKPPEPKPAKKVFFPQYITRDLANGMRVLVIEHHEQPIVSLRFLVKSGSAEDGDLPGLANLTGELLTKGTTNRSAVQIAEEIDYVGGQLVSGSDWDATYASVSILTKHLDVGLDILADVVLNPVFAENEVKRVLEQRLSALLQKKDDAGYLAERKLNAVIFGAHPYGQPNIGTEHSVKTLKREDFIRFHRTHFVPGNALLAVVGDVTADETLWGKVEKFFGSWSGPTPSARPAPPVRDLERRQFYMVEKSGAVQSAIRVGHVGIARKSTDFVPVMVLNTLLGGYFNSRLNINLREGKGFTYGAGSSFDARQYPGPFVVSADVRNGVTDSAIVEILHELDRIRNEPVTEEELEMVKQFILGSFPLQIETPNQIASRAIDLELYGLPRDYYDQFNRRVETIAAADLQSVAQKYLHPDRLAVVVAGDSKSVASKLQKFGPVEVVDADGKKILP